MKSWQLWAALAVLIMLSACAPTIQTVYVPDKLYPEPRPLLPIVTGAELKCLSIDTVDKIVHRDKILRDDDNYLRTLINPTGEVK